MHERVTVAGVGKCLPDRVVTNEDVLKILVKNRVTKTSSGKTLTADIILKTCGISERRRIEADQDVSDLALIAAKDALKKAGICWDDLNIIRVGTSTPEAAFPSTACSTLMKAAGPNIEASDVLAACTSSLYAMIDVQSRLLAEEDYHYGLVVGTDAMASRLASPTDLNYDLWGEGAGAVVLKKSTALPYKSTGKKIDETLAEDTGIICSMAGSIPEMAEKAVSKGLGTRSGFENMPRDAWLAGTEIHKFILELLPNIIPATVDKANKQYFSPRRLPQITTNEIDMFILHQANGRIFKPVADRLGVPVEKFFQNVAKYGNTSSASVLIALCEAIEEGRIGHGSLVMLSAFGGGLTWATILIQL